MLQAVIPDQATSHTRKQHNTKRTRAEGVRLRKRDGQAGYMEYAVPFGVTFTPSMAESLEQIQCRAGDSYVTIEGRNLWPLYEDFEAKLCDVVQESPPEEASIPAVPYIESITLRLWL